MAEVKIQDIVEHLSSEMRRALEAAVKETIHDVTVDRFALFPAFRRAVGRKCNTWERVPDNLVKMD